MNEELVFPGPGDLEKLDETLAQALRTGDVSHLELLGYGEISCVLRFRHEGRAFACKRLPVFASPESLEAYAAVFDEYLRTLEQRAIQPTPSRLVTLEGPGNQRRVYCVQPELNGASLLPKWLKTADDQAARRMFLALVECASAAARGDLGVDGQLSNWALDGDSLRYLDVTTPLLRDSHGSERLDLDLFLASLPWALRLPVKKLMLGDILDKYYIPRGIVLDLLGNMFKEKLESKLPMFLEALDGRFSPAITEREVRDYYASDASTWKLLQRLRQMDRAWQTKVRRRVYPFLLPGPIER